MYERWMWIWCKACFKVYLALPLPATHKSLYGRFSLWLLGYAGAYAHSTRENFHQCSFFDKAEESR